jgi:hypothetical protein
MSMKQKFTALLGVCAMGLCMGSSALASTPIKPKHLDKINPNNSYVIVRIMGGEGIDLARYDPKTMRTFWSSVASSRNDLDMAFVGGKYNIGLEGVNGAKTFIIQVAPGSWLVSGWTFYSFSMGTYGFEVKPGEVTDIGTIIVTHSNDDVTEANAATADTLLLVEPSAADTLPAELAKLNVHKASIVKDIRFGNIHHYLFSRALGLPPLEHIKPGTLPPSADPAEIEAK